jgi:hypothetical protein
VFVTDDFPELGTDLVTALTTLNTDDFTHVEEVGFVCFCGSFSEEKRKKLFC